MKKLLAILFLPLFMLFNLKAVDQIRPKQKAKEIDRQLVKSFAKQAEQKIQLSEKNEIRKISREINRESKIAKFLIKASSKLINSKEKNLIFFGMINFDKTNLEEINTIILELEKLGYKIKNFGKEFLVYIKKTMLVKKLMKYKFYKLASKTKYFAINGVNLTKKATKWALTKIKENKIKTSIIMTSTGLIITGFFLRDNNTVKSIYDLTSFKTKSITEILGKQVEKSLDSIERFHPFA